MRQHIARSFALGAMLLLPIACDEEILHENLPASDLAVVAGTVRAGTGQALADVVLVLESMEDGVSATVRQSMASATGVTPAAATPGTRATTTDARGFFVFQNVAPGRYLLSGQSENHLRGFRDFHVPLSPAAETTYVDIDLTPTGEFYGNASLENGTDHQSTVVYAEGTPYVAVTDSQGDYRLTDVPVGTWTISAHHAGYLDQSTSGVIAAAGDSVGLTSLVLPLDSNIRPTVTADPVGSGCVGDALSFDAAAMDDDGSVQNYEWDFDGDGVFDWSSGSGAATTHVYATAGTYLAKVRVTDDDGGIGLDVVSVYVPVNTWYVSTSGNDGDIGNAINPFRTIARALNEAGAAGCDQGVVIAATGSYLELGLTFRSDVTVLGGYTQGPWTRTAGDYSVVLVGSAPAVASAITDALVSGLDIRATVVPAGATSVALQVINCGATVSFSDCKFTALAGGSGNTGTNGSPGGVGAAGQSGQPGASNSSGGGFGGNPGIGPGASGGPGGRGGWDGSGQTGSGGSVGTSGATPGFGGSGGPGPGSCSPPVAPGQAGTPASPAGPGAGGSGGSASGNAGPGGWTPTNGGNGGPGGTGSGGGGGGGGGGGDDNSIFCTGDRAGGGGGGGAGGTGGTAGAGGFGGGASFAVYVWGGAPAFTSCAFTAANGGSGGLGGNGGSPGGGGSGGSGGPGAGDATPGGAGGAGGAGGGGGGGQGGPGGPSWCIYRAAGAAPTVSGPTYTPGAGGAGGLGGFYGGTGSRAASGPNAAGGTIGP